MEKQTIESIKQEIKPGQKVSFVSGNFNIVHPGHLRLLRFAAECSDVLVVGVLSDKIGNTIISEDLRLEGVRAISWVDYAFIMYMQPEEIIKKLKPDIVVKGKEHENLFNSEEQIVETYGGKLLFSSGDVTFSSLELIKNERLQERRKIDINSHDYFKRHNIVRDKVNETINKYDSLKVIVIGDTIIDEYITCEAVGVSREDPTIVVTPLMTDYFLGAAGIVAAHAASFGAEVHFLSIIGNDDSGKYVEKKLSEYKVIKHIFIDDTRPTIRKQRYRANNKNLLRVNYLHHHDISKELQEIIINDVKNIVDDIDLVIFSDFNYGCLPQVLVDILIDLFKTNFVMMVADSQSSSQMGDVSRFKGMRLLTPTEREARLALNDNNSGLVVLVEKLRKKSNSDNILLTLGAEGVLIHAAKTENWLTDRLPSFNRNPKDESGAGDSFMACASLSMCVSNNIWISAYLGSIASAIQVSRIGNVPIAKNEIINNL